MPRTLDERVDVARSFLGELFPLKSARELLRYATEEDLRAIASGRLDEPAARHALAALDRKEQRKTLTIHVAGFAITLRAPEDISPAEFERLVELRANAEHRLMRRRHVRSALAEALTILGLDPGITCRLPQAARAAIVRGWAEVCGV